MNKRILCFVILSIPGFLFSLEYSFNSEQIRNLINSPQITTHSIPHESRWVSGASLLELLPLMEDVYRMEITFDSGNRILEDNDLAEYWGESFFLEDRREIDFLFSGELYENISGIEFSGTPMESNELEIWLSWEGTDELKDELGRFSRHHDISIHTIEVPSPESKLISVVRARGEVPDLVMLQSSGVENLVRSRAIQNLDYIRLTDLSDKGKEAFTLEDKLWGVPFYFDTQVIFYNKDLIPRPPIGVWTLEEMESIARGIMSRDIHPIVWNAYSSNWFIPFQIAFGKERLINYDGRITMNDSPTQKALEYVIQLKSEGLLVPMERDAMDALFIAGKIGMIMSGSYAIPYFETLGLDFGVLPFPLNQETDRNLSPLLDFKAFCMTRQTRSPILARRVLQFLTGSGIQQRFCPAMAKLPARDRVLDIPGIPYGYLSILKETVNNGTVIPPQHVYRIYKNNMWKLLRFALTGRMSVEDTLQQGQTLMNNTNQ